MKYNFIHKDGLGKLMLIDKEEQFSLSYFKQKSDYSFHTIAWNTGNKQKVYIDEVEFEFKENTVLPIMLNQSFRFEKPEDIIAWQFNREFYWHSLIFWGLAILLLVKKHLGDNIYQSFFT